MDFYKLVKQARTCRRFKQEELSSQILTELVDTARIVSSARNAQIVRYVIIQEKSLREKMEKAYVLGGALPPEEKPRKGIDEPTAYIIILAPENINTFGIMDIGISAQTLQLGATEKGYASCIIGAFKKSIVEELLQELKVDTDEENIIPYLVLALGIPNQERQITTVGEDGSTKYYHNEKMVNMVPKLDLSDVLLLQK